MRIILDNNVNRRFSALLEGYQVTHVQDIGWEDLRNGELIATAEAAGYQVMVTADKRMQYQQNLAGRRISIFVLNSLLIKWAHISPLSPQVLRALENVTDGSFVVISPNE